MSHRELSYDEATRQVANLMAATGQNANAYEDELSPQGGNSFEAAQAAVRAAEQHSDYSPAPKNLVVQMGQVAEDGHYEPSAEEERLLRAPEQPFLASEGLLQEVQDSPEVAPFPEGEDAPVDDVDWCATGEALIPEAIAPHLYQFHQVVECAGSLEEIWKAFERAQRTRGAETVVLPDRTLGLSFEKQHWVLRDEAQGLLYSQDGPSNPFLQSLVDPSDLFIWVLPLGGGTDRGYIHNGYIFLRRPV